MVLLRMQADGLLALPRPRCAPPRRRILFTAAPDPKPPVDIPVQLLAGLKLEQVTTPPRTPNCGESTFTGTVASDTNRGRAQLRYIARVNGEAVVLLGFGAVAWSTAPRDNFIGWNHKQRQKHLHLIVNNARFTVPPWIQSKNLASKLLSMTSRRLADDWQSRYNYRPILVETFVQKDQFYAS